MKCPQREDPETIQARLDMITIDSQLASERAGTPLKSLDEVRRGKSDTGQRVDAEPFKDWLRGLIARSSQREVATRLGVTYRTLVRWLEDETKELDEETVDRAVSREGTMMMRELYESPRPGTRPGTAGRCLRERCATPGCQASPQRGSRFCTPHAEFYARVRGELEDSAAEFRSTIGRKRKPRCCAPGCTNDRLMGERYCYDCQDAGWSEEVSA